MNDRFENFTLTILKLNKLVSKIKLLEMQEYGLKAIHVMCVYCLAGGEKMTAGELVKLTLEDKAAISRALATLKEKGFVEYDAGAYGAEITLTAKGEKVAEHIENAANKAVNAAGGNLTESERIEFYSSLGKICADLEKYYERFYGANAE